MPRVQCRGYWHGTAVHVAFGLLAGYVYEKLEQMTDCRGLISDAMERAKNFANTKQQNIVKTMDLTEFILDAHNIESCGNVLDLQRLRQDAPQWVE